MPKGSEKLWEWFGLSYASWLTVPRVLMHAMPDEWQGKMADLLREYDEAFPNQPPISTIVSLKNDKNKIVSIRNGPYAWLLNYRHPDQAAIDALRKKD